MGDKVKARLDRLEDVVSNLKEVPNNVFAEEVEAEDVETCKEVKSDGEVCGREKPCPYHGDDE